MSEETKPKNAGHFGVNGRLPTGKPFQAGNPGRPKGARAKISETFLKAVHADFEEHGAAVIATVRENDPSTYVRVIASLLPKEITGEDGAPLLSGIKVEFVRPGSAN